MAFAIADAQVSVFDHVWEVSAITGVQEYGGVSLASLVGFLADGLLIYMPGVFRRQ